MQISEIVNELEVVNYEYVIAAYIHGRYEIEVYSRPDEALRAIDRNRRNAVRTDEIRIEMNAKWRNLTASTYRRIESDSKHINEREIRAGLTLGLAGYFAGYSAGLNRTKIAEV